MLATPLLRPLRRRIRGWGGHGSDSAVPAVTGGRGREAGRQAAMGVAVAGRSGHDAKRRVPRGDLACWGCAREAERPPVFHASHGKT
jgi:hypothetical protein